MPVATSSPVKRAAGEGEEKGEGPTKGKQVRLQKGKSWTGVTLPLVPNSPTSRRAQNPRPVLVSRSLMWQPLLLMLLKLQLGKVVKELRCLTHRPRPTQPERQQKRQSKKVMQTITGTSVGHNVVIAMAGIAKVFAGEVVEEALKNLEDSGDSGQTLRPKHLREAVRKMRDRGAWVPKSKKTCPFT